MKFSEPSNNQKTIQSYEANINAYIEGTTKVVNGPVKLWIDRTCDGLIDSAKILEIRSGDGRSAKYIESKGYKVQRTDATLGFVKLIQNLNLTQNYSIL